MPPRIRENSRQQRLERMAKEVKDFGLEVASGFDVSAKNDFYKGCHATMGSPSFVMLDHEGRLAWYHVDPRQRDVMMLQAVAERLMGDASKTAETKGASNAVGEK